MWQYGTTCPSGLARRIQQSLGLKSFMDTKMHLIGKRSEDQLRQMVSGGAAGGFFAARSVHQAGGKTRR